MNFVSTPRVKKTFVRFGPYRLYRRADEIVTLSRGRTKELNYWTGPGPDGDLIWLQRETRTRKNGSRNIRWTFALHSHGESPTAEIEFVWCGSGLEQTSGATAAKQAWTTVSALPEVLRGLPEWGSEPVPAEPVPAEPVPVEPAGEISYEIEHFKPTGKLYTGIPQGVAPATGGYLSLQQLWALLCTDRCLPGLITQQSRSPFFSVVRPATPGDADRAQALGMPCVPFLVLPTAKEE